jgi:hypothetical protein
MSDEVKLWLPIAISLVSLLMSGLALGWNMYRELALRARVRVRFSIVSVDGGPDEFLSISATNMGPGPVQIEMIDCKDAPFWRVLTRTVKYFVVRPDFTNPLNHRLPHRLDVGDRLTELLPYDEQCLLRVGVTHVGFSDSFGRDHFAPKGQVRLAKRSFQQQFGNRGKIGKVG